MVGSRTVLTRIAAGTLFLFGVLAARPVQVTVFDLDRVGKPTPGVTITGADGSTFALTGLQGKPTLVMLFASWCEPCMLEIPWIRAAQREYGTQIQFVGVDVLDSPTVAVAFLHRLAFPFTVGFVDTASIDAVVNEDTRQQGGMKYRLPAAYAIAADGTVVGAWHGVPVQADGTPIDPLPDYLARLGVGPP